MIVLCQCCLLFLWEHFSSWCGTCELTQAKAQPKGKAKAKVVQIRSADFGPVDELCPSCKLWLFWIKAVVVQRPSKKGQICVKCGFFVAGFDLQAWQILVQKVDLRAKNLALPFSGYHLGHVPTISPRKVQSDSWFCQHLLP